MSNINDKAPAGATHRYEHSNNVDWYLQAEHGLYRWQQGSWCASVYKAVQDLVNSCPLGRLEAIPAEPAQPAEDDLTWLVRETKGEWFGNSTRIARDGLEDYLWAGPSVQKMVHRYPGYHWFTKEQYLARCAELQNKPGWKDAPEWALSVTQRSNGEWFWLGSTDQFMGPSESSGRCGEVLGDWRDTLERRPDDSITIDWSTAPEGATHHIGGGKLERPWHQELSHIRYWNGEKWVKRTAFSTTDEANAKGFAVVARPADLSEPAVTQRLDEATQNVLAAVPNLMGEQFKFEHNTKPVTVTNETVPMDKPVSVAGTGMPIADWAEKYADDPKLKALEALRDSIAQMPSNIVADLHQLCDAELTKRDAAVCGGQKYLDAHWFERGGLPPVGIECEIFLDGEWVAVFVVGLSRAGNPVVEFGPCNILESEDCKFRPIRTERDELTTLLTQAGITTCVDQAADAILAAGYKRGDA